MKPDNTDKLPDVDPAAVMRAMMMASARDVESRFPGANITLFISAPGCSKSAKPDFSYVTTAATEDMLAAVRAFLAENQH